jgi:hypothetical protein
MEPRMPWSGVPSEINVMSNVFRVGAMAYLIHD